MRTNEQSPDHKTGLQSPGWLLPVAVFLFAVTVYYLTSAPGLTWQNGGEDGGDLAIAAKLQGIAHPTGYPLYLILAQPLIWSNLEPVRALTILSALYAALTCTLVTLSVTRILQFLFKTEPLFTGELEDKSTKKNNRKLASDRITAYSARAGMCSLAGGTGAGVLLALSPLFWSQANIAEVYSLGAALTALTFWALMRWFSLNYKTGNGQKKGLWLVILTASLNAAHHRTGVITLVAAAVFIFASLGGWTGLLAFLRNLKAKDWLAGIILFVVGFLPYLYILSRGGQVPAANWLNPGWNNPGGFWDEFNASFYHNLLFAAPANQSLARISSTAQLLLSNFGIWGVILGLAGWWATATLTVLKPLFWFALAGFCAHVFFAIIYAADNGQVYLIPAFLIWSVLSGIGLAYLLLQVWQVQLPKPVYASAGMVTILVLAALQLILNYGSVDASKDKTATTWVEQTLHNSPPNAVLLTHEDKFTFGLWYEQYALGKRPDLILVETRLLNFDWYRSNLKKLYPGLKLEGEFNGADQTDQLIIANPDRQFFNADISGIQATKK